jgi:hypothetical protein
MHNAEPFAYSVDRRGDVVEQMITDANLNKWHA